MTGFVGVGLRLEETAGVPLTPQISFCAQMKDEEKTTLHCIISRLVDVPIALINQQINFCVTAFIPNQTEIYYNYADTQ